METKKGAKSRMNPNLTLFWMTRKITTDECWFGSMSVGCVEDVCQQVFHINLKRKIVYLQIVSVVAKIRKKTVKCKYLTKQFVLSHLTKSIGMSVSVYNLQISNIFIHSVTYSSQTFIQLRENSCLRCLSCTCINSQTMVGEQSPNKHGDSISHR